MSTLPLFGKNGDDDQVLRVGQLNRMVRVLLESRWNDVWVEGELSDVSHASSGHVYFSLNDESEQAQLRGVMFRSDARRSKAKLEDGARVKLRGGLSLFEPRGSFQLIARIALPVGFGELHAQFEAVRSKLEAEGLLAPGRKRKLPKLPRVLGVVTSAEGAALHDIVRVASARCPLRIVIAPCLVQGRDAPASIAAALARIQRLPQLDAVIVGRGGGAADDLSAFNDERLARALAACIVPVVSAVGHEVDVTIADLVADVRASTPSNAAELCVPDRRALIAELRAHERALQRGFEVRLSRDRLRLDRFARKLHEPRVRLSRVRARIERADAALRVAMHQRVRVARRALALVLERLAQRDPRVLCAEDRGRLLALHARLLARGAAINERAKRRLGERAVRLEALSPLAVLGRGYAIALHEGSGRALLRASDARPGDRIALRLHDGTLRTRVEEDG